MLFQRQENMTWCSFWKSGFFVKFFDMAKCLWTPDYHTRVDEPPIPDLVPSFAVITTPLFWEDFPPDFETWLWDCSWCSGSTRRCWGRSGVEVSNMTCNMSWYPIKVCDILYNCFFPQHGGNSLGKTHIRVQWLVSTNFPKNSSHTHLSLA